MVQLGGEITEGIDNAGPLPAEPPLMQSPIPTKPLPAALTTMPNSAPPQLMKSGAAMQGGGGQFAIPPEEIPNREIS